jgi:ATP-dependent Clp protease ATP-binding subunit ClpB
MFRPLEKKDIEQIIELQLKRVQAMLLEKDIKLDYTPFALEWIAKLGYDPQFGARPLKRVIQKYVLNELSKQILAGKIDKDATIILDVFDDTVVFRNPDKEKSGKKKQLA